MDTKVHLLGDGILDNYQYLEDQSGDLEGELVKAGFKVNNIASDNVGISDIINGVKPSNSKRKTDKDGKMYPLDQVINDIGPPTISSFGSKVQDNVVVVSMGGIDLEHALTKSHLKAAINALTGKLVSSVITVEYKKKYNDILKKLKSSCNKVILVNNYVPYIGEGSEYAKYKSYTTKIMNEWNQFISEVAKVNDVALLDLYSSFDYNDVSHYGKKYNYPSNKAVKAMSDTIQLVSKKYEGYKEYVFKI